MKKLLFASTILAAAAALPASGVLAAGDKGPKADQPASQTQSSPSGTMERGSGAATGATQRDWSSARELTEQDYSQLSGKTVQSVNGKEVGEIQEVVQSTGSDKTFAVIGVGGFLGIGEKTVAVPVEELRRDSQEEDMFLVSENTASQLESMKEYDKSQYQPYQGQGAGGSSGPASGTKTQ